MGGWLRQKNTCIYTTPDGRHYSSEDFRHYTIAVEEWLSVNGFNFTCFYLSMDRVICFLVIADRIAFVVIIFVCHPRSGV